MSSKKASLSSNHERTKSTMSEMINFGIDLGTTNSLIAKFNKGTVEVFKNPNGHKETLPSVAGFKQVVLLQEPIAASLAYADKEKSVDLKNSQWIVYDLGGGTFDVALVKIVEGELKIVDHEGDNYLGGADFDSLIVERIIAPWLEKKGKFSDLLTQMKSDSGKHNRLWVKLLGEAERAKIDLSAR